MPATFLEACIKFFGLRPGQSRMDFMRDEYKRLTPTDKAEIHAGFVKLGVDCAAPTSPTT